jgi:metal-responsive CopG/Arc/MetJ family transcriptional regulator
MHSVSIHLKLSADLIQKINEAAQANYTSRSDFIREAVVMRLNNQLVVKNPQMSEILEVLTKVEQNSQGNG